MPPAPAGDTCRMAERDERAGAPDAEPVPTADPAQDGAAEEDAAGAAGRKRDLEQAERDRLTRFLERLHTSQADPAVTDP